MSKYVIVSFSGHADDEDFSFGHGSSDDGDHSGDNLQNLSTSAMAIRANKPSSLFLQLVPVCSSNLFLFDWFGIICMTTDNCCFYLQNKTNPNQSNRRSTVQ
jgi:hypothetical protein